MSQENVELIERFFELYNRREIDAWVEMLGPDLEWHIDPEDPDTTIHRGPEAAKRHVLYWAELMNTTVEVREIFKDFKLRDGLVVRVQETQDKREALEAVGLSE